MSIDRTALNKAQMDWNASADEYNQWHTLSFEERLEAYEAAKTEQPDDCSEAYREWIKGRGNIDKGPWDAWQAAWRLSCK